MHYSSGELSIVSNINSENDNVSNSNKEDIEKLQADITKNFNNNSTPIKFDNNVFNVLIIGVDARHKDERSRSDSMIIVSINKNTKKIVATSLLRDIYVQIPGVGSNRLNAACAFGGPKLLLDTIQQNFKIKIDKYIQIDFFEFIDIIDSVGGVSIDVSAEESVYLNGYVQEINSLKGLDKNDGKLTETGKINLTGKQALGYSRIRYIGSDFERTARQRRVLEQVFNKVKDLNIIQINDLLNQFLPQITTNLTKGEICNLALDLSKYKSYTTQSFRVPTDLSYKGMGINGMSVISIDFPKNINLLQKTIYSNSN